MHVRDDGITESYSSSDSPAYGSASREAGQQPESDDGQGKKHKYDSPESLKLLNRLREWFDQEWQRQAFNRYQMAMDEDYYDSLQYTEEDAAELMMRGQAPTVYNEIKPTIDWMIGTERRTRIDYKVLPRRKEDGDIAENKTKLMKYLSDTNKSPYSRSKAFGMTAKAGLGWLEVGARGDDSDEPVFYRSQSWRYMLYDSNGVENDLSDGRYVFRWKYLDDDVALAMFPDRKSVIKRSIVDGQTLGLHENEDELWYMGARVTEPGQDFASATAGKYRPYDGSAFSISRRDRAKIYECWYRVPVNKWKFRGGDYDGEVYNKNRAAHVEALKDSQCSLYDRIEMQIRCALFTDAGLLHDSESPYNHNRFPFVPIWAFRRSRDNAPYGPIRAMRDPQDSLNKRGSKALWILSSTEVTMDEGAVDDIDELREEVSRPDRIIVKKKGTELTISRDVQLAEEHLMLMDRDQSYIRNGGGVTEENLGRETNAHSGKAIIARQEQGSVVTTEIFDNLSYAVQLAGEIELSLIEQFFTEEKTVRLLGERGNAQFVEVNKRDEATGEVLNDITATQADFKVSEQDYRDSLRQAMFESLMDIVTRLAQLNPQVALNLLDLVVEMVDIPNRDEFVARIRQLSGMRDPEAEPTEEELLAEQQQKQLQDLQIQNAIETAAAELQKTLAQGEKFSADAINAILEGMYASIQAAALVTQNPSIAPIADELLTSAGYVDATPDQQISDVDDGMQPIPGQQPEDLPLPQPESPFTGVRQGIETPETD